MSWPPITVMVYQVVGTPAAVLLEVGPAGLPHRLLSGQARRIAESLTGAAELVDTLGGDG